MQNALVPLVLYYTILGSNNGKGSELRWRRGCYFEWGLIPDFMLQNEGSLLQSALLCFSEVLGFELRFLNWKPSLSRMSYKGYGLSMIFGSRSSSLIYGSPLVSQRNAPKLIWFISEEIGRDQGGMAIDNMFYFNFQEPWIKKDCDIVCCIIFLFLNTTLRVQLHFSVVF